MVKPGGNQKAGRSSKDTEATQHILSTGPAKTNKHETDINLPLLDGKLDRHGYRKKKNNSTEAKRVVHCSVKTSESAACAGVFASSCRG